MLVRGVEDEILPFCLTHNVGVISYSPMRNGLLSGGMTKERVELFPEDDFRRRLPDFQEPKLSKNLKLAEKLRAIGAKHGRKPGEVAIAWALANPAVTGAIVGMRAASQVDGVVGAAEFRLSAEELSEIEAALSSE
jgi:aryl-alcohol dehydrogenase-like predicted oxidoreductase